MRLTDSQIRAIKQLAHEIAGEHAQVRVFGSRLDDDARGGDLDLMLELPEPVDNPALLADALQAGHDFVPILVGAANGLMDEIERRGWAK